MNLFFQIRFNLQEHFQNENPFKCLTISYHCGLEFSTTFFIHRIIETHNSLSDLIKIKEFNELPSEVSGQISQVLTNQASKAPKPIVGNNNNYFLEDELDIERMEEEEEFEEGEEEEEGGMEEEKEQ